MHDAPPVGGTADCAVGAGCCPVNKWSGNERWRAAMVISGLLKFTGPAVGTDLASGPTPRGDVSQTLVPTPYVTADCHAPRRAAHWTGRSREIESNGIGRTVELGGALWSVDLHCPFPSVLAMGEAG
jgi:hypothetical protein